MSLDFLPKVKRTCLNLIGGEWQASAGPLIPVRSPYTGEILGEVPLSSATDVAAAVQAADAAWAPWRAATLKERSEPLARWRGLLLTHLDELASTAAAESGKTVAEARAELRQGLDVVEFALGLQNFAIGQSQEVSRGIFCRMQREPLGVVCGITPFNFPAMIPLWMIPIALTLGNCFILKPSEKVPLTAQRLGELILAAGYPPGVFSLVNGGSDCANALATQPLVQAVAFVGSTTVAKSIYATAAAHGKRALALGGAKNQLILLPDADPKIAIPGVVDSFTGCAGQRCMAASLALTVGDCEPLLALISQAAAQVCFGTAMGAIIDAQAKARILGIIARAEEAGATIRLDGRNALAPAGCEQGHWLGATIIDHAKPGMECVTTEIFGPVLTIIRLPHLAAAVSLERASPYGNATSVFTTSGTVAEYVAQVATSSMVGINIGVPVPREPFSFGGSKASKFGAGDITGSSSIEFWSKLKKITSKWASVETHDWMS